MPLNLTEEEDGGIVFTGTGVIDGIDGLTLNHSIYSSEEKLSSIRYQLIDLTEVTTFNFSATDMRKLAGADRRALALNPRMRIAIVAPDAFAFGMNRLYHSGVGDNQERVKVFKDLQEARDWLGEVDHESPEEE